MEKVFVVTHSYLSITGEEEVKLIGVYSSWANAESAVARLRLKPGFADHADGFHIDELKIDFDSWAEGFVNENYKL